MRNVVCTITGETQEAVLAARSIAMRRSDPDAIKTFISRTFPRGVEKVREEHFRIGDYFDHIDISDDDPLSFQIVFHVREGVDSFWKDIVVSILFEFRGIGLKSLIEQR